MVTERGAFTRVVALHCGFSTAPPRSTPLSFHRNDAEPTGGSGQTVEVRNPDEMDSERLNPRVVPSVECAIAAPPSIPLAFPIVTKLLRFKLFLWRENSGLAATLPPASL